MKCRTPMPGARLWAAIAALAIAAISPLPAQTGPDNSWGEYRVLVERNIFLRDRRRPQPRGPSLRPAEPVVRDSDRDIVLIGVGRHDGEFVAFFENTATRITIRVAAGQAVGKGKVQAITLDGVDYERDGAVTRIDIGYGLGGGQFARETVSAGAPAATQPGESPLSTTGPSADTAGPQAQTMPAPARSGAGSDDIDEILKRLRQRREQELRK